jgi:hypothetical protein
MRNGVRRETIPMVGWNFSIRKSVANKVRGFDANFLFLVLIRFFRALTKAIYLVLKGPRLMPDEN